MILSRLSQALRTQNWLAVALEFAIVVLGVYLAFQLATWSEARQQDAEATRLQEQLEIEVSAAVDEIESWIAYRTEAVSELHDAILTIQSNDPERGLSEQECEAIWGSHIVIWNDVRLVTLDEIIATGRLSILPDTRLRRALLEYRNENSIGNSRRAFIAADLSNVVDTFAEEMPRFIEPGPTESSWLSANRVDCQLQPIRENATLRNRLISNLGRTRGMIGLAEQELEHLRVIQRLLATED
ncbi:hypothetical protein V0U79_09475 [Hyphobacterium sp. HN65]|uniref:Uncharacterized protein n=1 Tax=Hyphobacterium lacteum TaxID=3116575 RepID=A0ABU7LRR2_9PROT|nr:hypothetical protein [Hyphobacterium sp. HN65]MEE2526596.1 hypothetical protein [Hyphobacterium sp. HN65]